MLLLFCDCSGGGGDSGDDGTHDWTRTCTKVNICVSFDYCHFICKSYVYNIWCFALSVRHGIIIILQCTRVCPPSYNFLCFHFLIHSLVRTNRDFFLAWCSPYSTSCDIIIVLLVIYLLTHRKKIQNWIERRKQFIHMYLKKEHQHDNVCEQDAKVKEAKEQCGKSKKQFRWMLKKMLAFSLTYAYNTHHLTVTTH